MALRLKVVGTAVGLVPIMGSWALKVGDQRGLAVEW